MTYYNILFRFNEEAFIRRAAEIGMKGLIVPDLPPEEGQSYLRLCKEQGIAPSCSSPPPARKSGCAR